MSRWVPSSCGWMGSLSIISPLLVSCFTENRPCEPTVCRADRMLGGAGLAFTQTSICLVPVLSHIRKTTAMHHDQSKDKYLMESFVVVTYLTFGKHHYHDKQQGKRLRWGRGTMRGQINQFSYLISTRMS